MGRVRVVTDTTHYLPRELVEREELAQVSLYVSWNGHTDREADLGDFGAYYDHLRTAKDLPTTSQPSVGDFMAVYEPILAAGDDIVSLHLSGGISGTVRTAEQAQASLVESGVAPQRVVVVDSETACGGLGLVAMAAAAAAEGGAGAEGGAAAARAGGGGPGAGRAPGRAARVGRGGAPPAGARLRPPRGERLVHYQQPKATPFV